MVRLSLALAKGFEGELSRLCGVSRKTAHNLRNRQEFWFEFGCETKILSRKQICPFLLSYSSKSLNGTSAKRLAWGVLLHLRNFSLVFQSIELKAKIISEGFNWFPRVS